MHLSCIKNRNKELQMELIDFDMLFQKYLTDWYADNEDKYKNIDEMEGDMFNVYMRWLDTENPSLDGIKPSEYFDKFNTEQLVNMFLKYFSNDIPIPNILADKIVDRKGVENELIKVLKRNHSDEIKIFVINMLNEVRDISIFDFYISMLFDDNATPLVRETVSELLANNLQEVKQTLIDKIEEASQKTKCYLADILRKEKDEKIFDLLMYLLKTESDRSLYAAYLGAYGDERALDALIELYKSNEINFIEYQEIQNSIEMLGGTVPVVQKDFSTDKYYKAMNKLKF